MTGLNSYREENLHKHHIDAFLPNKTNLLHTLCPAPHYPLCTNSHSLNNCSDMGSYSSSFWSEVQFCAWDRWVYQLPQFYIPVGPEAIVLSSTTWPQNTTDRKDLGNRIINWDNKKDKSIENVEGYCQEIQGYRSCVIKTFYGVPGNISRYIIGIQRN